MGWNADTFATRTTAHRGRHEEPNEKMELADITRASPEELATLRSRVNKPSPKAHSPWSIRSWGPS